MSQFEPLKEWQVRYQCLHCEDVIYSKYSGEYVECKCKSIAVDQTPYYSRFIGAPHLFKKVDEQL